MSDRKEIEVDESFRRFVIDGIVFFIEDTDPGNPDGWMVIHQPSMAGEWGGGRRERLPSLLKKLTAEVKAGRWEHATAVNMEVPATAFPAPDVKVLANIPYNHGVSDWLLDNDLPHSEHFREGKFLLSYALQETDKGWVIPEGMPPSDMPTFLMGVKEYISEDGVTVGCSAGGRILGRFEPGFFDPPAPAEVACLNAIATISLHRTGNEKNPYGLSVSTHVKVGMVPPLRVKTTQLFYIEGGNNRGGYPVVPRQYSRYRDVFDQVVVYMFEHHYLYTADREAV